jgi:hypothetical protein
VARSVGCSAGLTSPGWKCSSSIFLFEAGMTSTRATTCESKECNTDKNRCLHFAKLQNGSKVSQISLIAKRYHKNEKQTHHPALATTNLALRDGVHPHKHEVHDDHHYADDPEDACIVRVVVTEDDGKDDTTKVTCCTDDTRKDT